MGLGVHYFQTHPHDEKNHQTDVCRPVPLALRLPKWRSPMKNFRPPAVRSAAVQRGNIAQRQWPLWERHFFLVGLSNKSFVGNYWWVCTTGLTLILFPVRCKENILPIWLTMNQWTKSRFTHFEGLLLCATWLFQQSSTVEMAKASMHNPSFHMDLDSRSKFKNPPKRRIWQIAGTFDLSDTQWLKLYGKKQSII